MSCMMSKGKCIVYGQCDLCRNGDHAPDDIVPACQLTLKNLQLEYLDLYLMHWPLAQKKGVKLADLTDEENFGYTEEDVAETWKVCRSINLEKVRVLYGEEHGLKKSEHWKIRIQLEK